MNQSLEPFIHRKIVVLHENATAFEAARALCENRVGCVVISDHHGKISGLVTDRDLVCSMIAMNLSPETPLGDLMAKPLLTIKDDASLSEAISLMEKHGLRRIPVLSSQPSGRQKCVGLVTLDDLIAAHVIDSKQAGRIVQAQIRVRSAPYLRMKLVPVAEPERFLEAFANKVGLSKEQARAVAIFVLSTVVRRLHYTAAVQFVLQTPQEFHKDLLALPAGPDRTIDAQYFITGVSSHMHGSDEDAKDCLKKLWETIFKYGEEDKLNHTFAQLPKDVRQLFGEGQFPKNEPPIPLR